VHAASRFRLGPVHPTPVSFCMLWPQEREAHAAADAQFRSLYRDKYAPLKAWLAGAEGEVRGPPLPAGAHEMDACLSAGCTVWSAARPARPRAHGQREHLAGRRPHPPLKASTLAVIVSIHTL